MRHFPATRFHPALDDTERPRAPRRPIAAATVLLLCAVCFGAGYCAALAVAARVIGRLH